MADIDCPQCAASCSVLGMTRDRDEVACGRWLKRHMEMVHDEKADRGTE